MLDELGLMQRMQPHPKTQELGVWLSRDEVGDLIDGLHKEGLDVKEELDDAKRDAEYVEGELVHISTSLDKIIKNIKADNSIDRDDILISPDEVLP
jgi:hypothetical protein